MAARDIQHGLAARSSLVTGARKAARAVAVTYGPHGRLAILDRAAGHMATKDGVTVAREVGLSDRLENQGAQIVTAACIKVNDDVGDGTTTVAVLVDALLAEGHKLIAAGHDPMALTRGMQKAGTALAKAIRAMAHKLVTQEDVERVAMLSSNGDREIAKHLAEACMAVGKDGTVTVEDGVGLETTLEFKEGMELADQGPCDPRFLKDKTERVLDDPLVAVIHGRLRSVADVQDMMEAASQWPNNPLVVFCLIAEGDALTTMVLNDAKNVVRCVPIGAPGTQGRKEDYLRDIAALSGATFVDTNAGLHHRTWDADWFGGLKQVTTGFRRTVLVGRDGASPHVAERIMELRAQETTCKSDYDRDRIQERLAKLSGGLALLKVGGATEAAMKERRARVEDALSAVRCALRGGVVAGGGVAYLRAAQHAWFVVKDRGDEYLGADAVRKAFHKPLQVLADNAGAEGVVVVDAVRGKLEAGTYPEWSDKALWEGWDALTGTYRNLFADPMVADPTEVAVAVVTTAISVATTLLTAETAILFSKP